MKKFVFSLQALYRYKQTVEKLQKGELSQAQAALRELETRLEKVLGDFERGKSELDAALKTNTRVIEALTEYDGFFRHLNEQKKVLLVKIKEAERIRDKCQEALVITMREIKAYKKLREEQYRRYLKEVQAEEEKSMSDLVSFDAIRSDAETGGTDG